MRNKLLQIWGVLFCGSAVILGAFGAHLLSDILSNDALQSFEVGVRYQFFHGLALLFLSLTSNLQKFINRAARLFIVGTLLFSISILSFVHVDHVWRYWSTSYFGPGNSHWWANAYFRMDQFAYWLCACLS